MHYRQYIFDRIMNRITVRINDLTMLPTALTSVPGTPEHPTGRATDHTTLAVLYFRSYLSS